MPDKDSSQTQSQRDSLMDSERQANKDQPRNFKPEAVTDKVVKVEPDGTGPSPMDSMDPKEK